MGCGDDGRSGRASRVGRLGAGSRHRIAGSVRRAAFGCRVGARGPSGHRHAHPVERYDARRHGGERPKRGGVAVERVTVHMSRRCCGLLPGTYVGIRRPRTARVSLADVVDVHFSDGMRAARLIVAVVDTNGPSGGPLPAGGEACVVGHLAGGERLLAGDAMVRRMPGSMLSSLRLPPAGVGPDRRRALRRRRRALRWVDRSLDALWATREADRRRGSTHTTRREKRRQRRESPRRT